LIKCIIVEDEELAQEVIKRHLEKIDQLSCVGIYRNARDAAAALQQKEVDLIFLDIRLPGMSGLHFLSTLKEPPLVILTTAYAEYALESYEFNVIDYLLKPISFERFSKAVGKVLNGKLWPVLSEEQERGGSDHIFIKASGKYFKVDFSEIVYVQGMKDYLKIHTSDYSLMTLRTMNDIERLLPPKRFIRVHKSYLVAIAHIRSIYGNSVELDKETIPIGNSYKETVMQLVVKGTG
jgi:DNA-binding LytR/AlgR family response regulator